MTNLGQNGGLDRTVLKGYSDSKGAKVESVDQYLNRASIEPGRYRLVDNGIPIDMDLAISPGEPLTVVLHGRKAEGVVLPYLSGAGITQGLPTSRLSISDPSLYLDERLSIAWFAGNSKQVTLQEKLTQIVEHTALLIGSKRIVLFGGSAGGFAAIVTAHQVPNAVAVVWNPQTDIFRYYKRFAEEYVSFCWGTGTPVDPSVTTSAVDLYSSKPSEGSTVLYRLFAFRSA